MVWSTQTFMKMCFILMMCPRRIRLEPPSTDGPVTDDLVHHKNVLLPEFYDGDSNDSDAEYIDTAKHETALNLTESEMVQHKVWPRGIIPYFIDEFSFDKVLRDRIRKAVDMCNALTGIQFIELPQPPEDDDTRWVFLVNRMGQLDCIDHPIFNFTNQGVQKIVLGYDCLQEPNNMGHIFLSLIGVPPQHNSPNRDDYIEIVHENILPNKKHLFKKLSENEWLFNNHPYDFASASHYDFHAYTANGLATIRPKKAIDIPVGEVKVLSNYDIRKVKMLYSNQINKKSSIKVAQCLKLYKPTNKYQRGSKLYGDPSQIRM